MNDPRLAFLRPSHPYQVSYRLNRRQSRLTLIVDCPDGIAGHLCAFLETSLGLAHQLRRVEEAAARTLRTDRMILAMKKQHARIRAAYLKLRRLKVKHRAAVLAVSEQPEWADLRERYRWTRATFSACIGPASLYQPSVVGPGPHSARIRAVPVPNTESAQRTLSHGAVKTRRAAS